MLILKKLSASFLAMAIMVASGLSNRALADIHSWGSVGEEKGVVTAYFHGDTLQRIESGLRETPVIGLFDKISLKNQLDALIDGFRRYHQVGGEADRRKLKAQFMALIRRTLDLLEGDRTGLYKEIEASRVGLWTLMADRRTFAEFAVSDETSSLEKLDRP